MSNRQLPASSKASSVYRNKGQQSSKHYL